MKGSTLTVQSFTRSRAGLSQLAALFRCSQWCVAKNKGGFITLETRRRAASAEGAEGVEFLGRGVGVSPSPADQGVWGSVASSPSGIRGAAPAANAF